MIIDAAFDFRTDAFGKDPDGHSKTLRSYHRILWSKPLPSGEVFTLSETVPGAYLHHSSGLGSFTLASDSILQTFTRWRRTRHIVETLTTQENEEFQTIAYTIGGMMVFPANKVDGKITINGARGFISKISDRMDLTLECIRRHYAGNPSPLAATLARYCSFFDLFGNFANYVDFFLLHDLVETDRSSIKFFDDFNDFQSSGVPPCEVRYREFRQRSIAFVLARNARIDEYCRRSLIQRT